MLAETFLRTWINQYLKTQFQFFFFLLKSIISANFAVIHLDIYCMSRKKFQLTYTSFPYCISRNGIFIYLGIENQNYKKFLFILNLCTKERYVVVLLFRNKPAIFVLNILHKALLSVLRGLRLSMTTTYCLARAAVPWLSSQHRKFWSRKWSSKKNSKIFSVLCVIWAKQAVSKYNKVALFTTKYALSSIIWASWVSFATSKTKWIRS